MQLAWIYRTIQFMERILQIRLRKKTEPLKLSPQHSGMEQAITL
jgi:hypothetical protein